VQKHSGGGLSLATMILHSHHLVSFPSMVFDVVDVFYEERRWMEILIQNGNETPFFYLTIQINWKESAKEGIGWKA